MLQGQVVRGLLRHNEAVREEIRALAEHGLAELKIFLEPCDVRETNRGV